MGNTARENRNIMSKNFNNFKIPESLRIASEIQKTIDKIPKFDIPQFNIPKFDWPVLDIPKIDIPVFNIPKIDLPKIDYSVLEALREIPNIVERLNNNPEMQFAFISDLEILNLNSAEDFKESIISNLIDESLTEKEELLNRNLFPYLERHNLSSLWVGANYALNSNLDENPDKLRHCLISVRTILENIIDEKLAPKNKLANEEMFRKEFKRYNEGKDKLDNIRISRAKKIEYITSKIEFGMLEDFTKNEIEYICSCYTILCDLHNPNIGISELQVRNLKVKTGITIWLLLYILEILEK